MKGAAFLTSKFEQIIKFQNNYKKKGLKKGQMTLLKVILQMNTQQFQYIENWKRGEPYIL